MIRLSNSLLAVNYVRKNPLSFDRVLNAPLLTHLLSLKKVFLKISLEFTGKHLCWSIFVIKLRAFRLEITKTLQHRWLLL